MELPLRQHFEECGKVEAVRLVRDRNSGVGKGFGYVLFEVSRYARLSIPEVSLSCAARSKTGSPLLSFQSADSVMLALKLNGSQLLDRKIRVMRSVKKVKEKQGGGPPGRNPKRQNGRAAGRRKGPQPASFKPSTGAEAVRPAGKSFKRSPGTGSKISFQGETVDPSTKKGLKKRFKPKKNKKTAHV